MHNILTPIHTALGHLNYAVFLLLLCTLPLPWHITQPLLVVWISLWGLEQVARLILQASGADGISCPMSHSTIRQNIRHHLPLWLLLGYVAWEALSLLWSSDTQAGKELLWKHLPLLAVCVVALLGVNEHYRPIHLKRAIYASSLVSVGMYMMLIYWSWHNGVLQIYGRFFEWEPWAMLGSNPIGLIKHRHYYCLILLLALCQTGSLYRYYRARYPRWSVWLTLGIGDLILLTAILLSGSRMMLALTPVIALVAMIRYRHTVWKRVVSHPWLTGCLVIFVIGAGMYVWRHNSRIEKSRKEFQWIGYEQSRQAPLSREPRIYIWHTVWHSRSEYGLWGMGFGSAYPFLMQQYEKDGIQEMINKGFGVHSQYLTIWMEQGPLAVLFILFILCFAPWYKHRHSSLHGATKQTLVWDTLYLCLIYGWGMVTETMCFRMSALYILYAMLIVLTSEEQEAYYRPRAGR